MIGLLIFDHKLSARGSFAGADRKDVYSWRKVFPAKCNFVDTCFGGDSIFIYFGTHYTDHLDMHIPSIVCSECDLGFIVHRVGLYAQVSELYRGFIYSII